MDKDGYHGYDMSKLTSSNTALTFQKPQENNIVFYNTMGGQHTEVLRITKDGITANPDVLVDEAADAVIRALDGYIKNLTRREWKGLSIDERNDCLVEADPCECLADPEAEELMHCIEAKLKEKNA